MAKPRKRKAVANCPDCGAPVTLKEPVNVGAKLEVISLAPELDYAYEEWEEEEEEDM